VSGVPLYLDVLMLLNFLVDLLLLLAANRLSGYPIGIKRAALAAGLGGVYGGICLLPGFRFLGGTLWRMVSLALMAGIAYGFSKEAVRRGVLFVLLSMSLGGIAVGMERGSFTSLILSALGVCLMCIFGLKGKIGAEYVQVQIGDLHLTALRDTGNTLTDPLTGQQILVVSANVGRRLLGLSAMELSDPMKAMGKVPGLRLVPFHAVGCSGGVLPVKRFENVKIGSWSGSCLVAFAPNELGQGKPYEALTGGVL
jgi:stage II sporulation protein GA (sporulation sigma-E factor processing peptidase)